MSDREREEEYARDAHEANMTEMEKLQEQSAEGEFPFVHYKGPVAVAKGFSFQLGSSQRLVQAEPVRTSGIQRLRVVLCDSKKLLWDPEHEVFVGLSYGQGKYFGYLCSATAFSGIFSVRSLTSAAPEPNPPVHLTGSGNKVEFDIALEVQLQRVNMIVQCKLSVIMKSETVSEELFQLSSDTVKYGQGLQFQLVATGLKDEEIDVQLGWVSGGGNEEAEAAAGINVSDEW